MYGYIRVRQTLNVNYEDGTLGLHMHRRNFLGLGASAVTTSLLAGCSGVVSSEPTYSFEAIVGVWSGETYEETVLVHDMARVEITTETAKAGEVVGSVRFIDKQENDVVCSGSMLAHHSDPPTFWMGVQGEGLPCKAIARVRFLYKPEHDKILWFTRTVQRDSYESTTTLNPESG
jgi:hypothetical protein